MHVNLVLVCVRSLHLLVWLASGLGMSMKPLVVYEDSGLFRWLLVKVSRVQFFPQIFKILLLKSISKIALESELNLNPGFFTSKILSMSRLLSPHPAPCPVPGVKWAKKLLYGMLRIGVLYF